MNKTYKQPLPSQPGSQQTSQPLIMIFKIFWSSLPGISSSLTIEIVLNFCLRSSIARTFLAPCGARSEEIPSRDDIHIAEIQLTLI